MKNPVPATIYGAFHGHSAIQPKSEKALKRQAAANFADLWRTSAKMPESVKIGAD